MAIVVSDVFVDESQTFARFTIRLTAASAQTVSVSYNCSNETALNGSDYTAKSGTISFAPGQTEITVDIPLIGNVAFERAESFRLNLFSAVNDTIFTPFARATVVDNDAASGTPVVRVSSQVVDEASGQAAFIVQLDKPSTGVVTVGYATANGSATAGSDYVAQSGQTLTFQPGEMVKTVLVALVNDTAAESREYFDLVLSSPVGATLEAQPSGRTSIGANDLPTVASPLITVADGVADESNTYMEFVVSLSAPSTLPVSVSYNNSNITAANGSDYQAQSSSLTFAPGETTKVIRIPVLDELTDEPTQVLALNLFSPVNGTVARPFALGTLYDNDGATGTPLVRVADQVVDEASGQVSFVVYLNRPSTAVVKVDYATFAGSAAAGSDFVAQAPRTLTFQPGEVVKVVDVALINDTSAEVREYFDLRLSSPVNATLEADPTGRASIGANDLPTVASPLISVSNASADESRTYINFVVSLNAPSTLPVSVSYNNSNVTAANGSDYFAQSSTLTFAPGETTKVVRIALQRDLAAEPTEVMAFNLFSAVNGTIVRPLAHGTITDNDAASGTPVIRVSDHVVDEASGQVGFQVSLDRPSTGTVTVKYATVDGSATAGSDYVAQALQTLTFQPGEMVKSVQVALINDSVAETREYFDLRLSSAVGATIEADPTGRASIGANDLPTVASPLISVADATADEGSTYLNFVVSLRAPSTLPVSVSYNNSNVTAANGSDYLAQSSTLTFAPGETTKVVQIALLDDLAAERDEVLALNLFSAVNGTIVRPLAHGRIVDNDAPTGTPMIRVADQVVDEAAGQVNFLVTLDKPSTGVASVKYATLNGSALAGSDYAAVALNTLTFQPGETAKVVSVALTNDTAVEAGEYFDLKLSAPVGATLVDTNARAFIGPNDKAPVASPLITVADVTADEHDTYLDFVVSLNAPSTLPVSLSYNNSNLTAANGSDYLAQSSALTFAPGETTKVIRIPVLDDLTIEPSEYFTLNLFSASNGTIVAPQAIGTVADNDAVSGTPLVSISDGIVNEADPRAAFIISLDRPSTTDVRVNYGTTNGTASGTLDYEVQSTQTVVFAPGETSKTVYVNLLDDALAEPSESFDMNIFGPGGATIADPRGHMIVAPSDATTVALPVIQAASIGAPEGGGYLEFIVSLSAPSSQLVKVSYNNSNQTAANGSDYLALSGTLTFAPGETLHTVRVPVLDDINVESTESFSLNLFSAVNATIGTSTVVGSILDNDGAPLPTQLVNNGTANADALLGRPGANAVVGSSGDDVLDVTGGGTMQGGAGNDLYFVETVNDAASEAAGQGTDIVVSYINYALGPNMESLLLRAPAAAGDGNALNNFIGGNEQDNILNGGAGADTMVGGLRHDIYTVDNPGDVVRENPNEGTDLVKSSVSYALAANVENLTLTGAGAINGTGNELGNALVGNGAANVLNGRAGADTLTGATGTDTFRFDSLAGVDTVTDWSSINDSLLFSMAGVRVGDGDSVVEGAVVRGAPGGFSSSAELVIFTADIAGPITAASAAAAIGSATSAYATGADVLFAVDNGAQTGVFRFHSSGSDALVSAAELAQVALLNGGSTTLGDYFFTP